MNTKIIDSFFLKIQIPVLMHAQSLEYQFGGRSVDNDKHLHEAASVLSSCCQISPVSFDIVIVETGTSGDSPLNIVTAACESAGFKLEALMVPSPAQIGHLTEFFREEVGIKRMLPVIIEKYVYGIEWERSFWRTSKPPVFRFHRPDGVVHKQVHVMLPRSD